MNERSRHYRKAHPISQETAEQREKRLAAKARHREKHREALAAKQTARYHADPERHRAMASSYQREHREERVAYHKRWRDANVEHVRAYGVAQERRRRLGKDELAVEYAAVLLRDPCSYCGGPSGTLDHIVPVSEGGSNEWWNLTGACARCNSRKRTRSLVEMLAAG